MRVCKYRNQRAKKQVNRMENLSRVLQKKKKKSIQD